MDDCCAALEGMPRLEQMEGSDGEAERSRRVRLLARRASAHVCLGDPAAAIADYTQVLSMKRSSHWWLSLNRCTEPG